MKEAAVMALYSRSDSFAQNNTRAMAPVLVDYADSESNQELAVSFIKCQFLVSPFRLFLTKVSYGTVFVFYSPQGLFPASRKMFTLENQPMGLSLSETVSRIA